MVTKRVLVADDDEAVIDVLRALITSEPDLRLIGEANDAEQAIAIAVAEQPDVALIDVRMPGGGGMRAAREIARRCPRTRVIALTAHEDEATVIAMMAAGANAYVPKGESTERILREIHRPSRLVAVSSDGGELGVWSGDQPSHAGALGERRRAQRRRVRDALGSGAIGAVPRAIHDVWTGAIAGVFARTRVAKLPMRGADAWLAEAEAVDLLTEFEIEVLRAAVRDVAPLPSSAFLAVHVSPTTILDPAYRDAIGEAGRGQLLLELTEHARVEDYASLNDAVAPLREAGVRLAVCDVGAGPGSLRHVAMLAPDVVIVDVALTDGVERDGARHAIVAALAARARQLGARTLAEHVTTAGQLEELIALGVDLVAGPAGARFIIPPAQAVQGTLSSSAPHADV
jgi:EAL domain-containing protein (putative c-di-GMP-specific phosphodiesterase class I)/ActR/RegA family two-component response regulator